MPGPKAWSLPAHRLERRFEDKKPALDRGEAIAEASRCLYCYDAPCIQACPTQIDIPTFIRKIATENLRGSARTILSANLLGASCSRVCPVEVLCEGACVYVAWGRRPIEIGRLQRYAMDAAQSTDLFNPRPPSGRSVGLVGAGPASLACAGTLALLGHRPVIYEQNLVPGGLNVTGVAPYKLQGEHALREAEFIRSLGVEIQTGVRVGEDLFADELLERHDAVFLGLGLGDDSFQGVPERESNGVVGAVEWIRSLKLDPDASLDGIHAAVVVGGGNTALDVAQEMASLGVEQVHVVYRRSESEMPGYAHEWNGAKRLKVRLIDRAAIAKLHRDEDGRLKDVELVRTDRGRPTEERLGSLRCDLLVAATGQERLRSVAAQFPAVECDERGRIKVIDEETLVTGNPRVFTGGDCYNGGREVVYAADEGQRAARAIDRLLNSDASEHTRAT